MLAEKLLGKRGKTFRSKTLYHLDNPGNFTLDKIFLIDDTGTVVWNGDLDVSKKEKKLIKLRNAHGKDLFCVLMRPVPSNLTALPATQYQLDHAEFIVTAEELVFNWNLSDYLHKDSLGVLIEKEVFNDSLKYNKTDFKKIRLPKISDLIRKNESPLEAFVSFFIKKYKTAEKAAVVYQELRVTSDYERELKKACVLYLKGQRSYISNAAIHYELGVAFLQEGPGIFYGTPDWAKDEYGYIKK